jgi:hypothetical protein
MDRILRMYKTKAHPMMNKIALIPGLYPEYPALSNACKRTNTTVVRYLWMEEKKWISA